MLTIFLAAAALLAPALADVYTITVPANSPTLRFLPNINGNADMGQWNASYTKANYSDKPGRPAPGDPAYWTTGQIGDGAPSVEYMFTGPSIRFWGYWGSPGSATDPGTSSEGSVELTIDGQTTSHTGNGPTDTAVVIAEATVDSGTHKATLVVRGGEVTVLYATADLDFGSVPLKAITDAEATALSQSDQKAAEGGKQTPSVLYTAVSAPGGNRYKPNPILNLEGYWGTFPNLGDANYYYPTLGSNETNAKIQVNIGSGVAFLRINGSLSLNHDQYTVTVDPAPPNMPSASTYNGLSWPWRQGATIYTAVLDPATNYSVTVENIPQTRGNWVDVRSFELWQTGPSSGGANHTSGNGGGSNNKDKAGATKSSNVGAIAGGVVGGVIVLALIGLLAFCFIRRRNRSRAPEPHFEIEQVDQAALSPYPNAPHTSAYTALNAYSDTSSYAPPSESVSSGAQSKLAEAQSRHAYHKGLAAPSFATSPPSSSWAPTHTATGSRSSVASFEQERDAGAVLPPVDRPPRQVVPPSYDPSWASEQAQSTTSSTPNWGSK